jgi:hypothetical protein
MQMYPTIRTFRSMSRRSSRSLWWGVIGWAGDLVFVCGEGWRLVVDGRKGMLLFWASNIRLWYDIDLWSLLGRMALDALVSPSEGALSGFWHWYTSRLTKHNVRHGIALYLAGLIHNFCSKSSLLGF